MMKKIGILLFLLSLTNAMVLAQGDMTPESYVAAYKDAAIQNMHLKHIPASITLAQGILESGSGNSKLARKANNHFGIKCHDWTGPSIRIDDDRRNECFRKYGSVLESYADHADFLSSRERYRSLFALDITDYKGWAHGLKKAGYATSPTYARKLIDIIERYNLNQYDRVKASDLPADGPIFAKKGGGVGSTVMGGASMANRINDVQQNNRVDYVIVKAGETKHSLALSLDTKVKKIEKYNELGPGDELVPGQIIYIQNKKSRAAKGNDFHTVADGDTMYSISQKYGIRLVTLLKKNNMWLGSEINPGDSIYLRKQKPLGTI